MKKYLLILCWSVFILSCTQSQFVLNKAVNDLHHINGKSGNGEYLYVTAGNSLYAIGNQYGGFPEVGWHIPGEMGGVWQHPIKLLDGFELSIIDKISGKVVPLNHCDQFIAYPLANRFEYLVDGISVKRTEFVPDSMAVLVVEYQFENLSNQKRDFKVALDINSDLRPVWLGERSGMHDSFDTLLVFADKTLILKDRKNTWYAGVRFDSNMQMNSSQKSPYKGKGISIRMEQDLGLDIKDEYLLRFYVSGSINDKNEVDKALTQTQSGLDVLYKKKRERYRKMDEIAAVTIPDTLWMKAYQWGKYNIDWLVRDIPGVGRAMSAGLPDYPWFFSNDQAATFSAIAGTHDPELFYHSWDMLKHISDEANKHNGRIIHEVSTNGVAYDKGRMEESQEFIVAAWDIFRWTGNMDFLRKYYRHGKNVWEFLQEHDIDHNLCPEGYGGIEIEGLNAEMLDVAVRTQVFLDVMAQAAEVLNEKKQATEYTQKAAILKQNINRDWWNESEDRFADFRSDKKKALEIIDIALEDRVRHDRNKWAQEKLSELRRQIVSGHYKDNGYVVFYNNRPALLPLAAGIADSVKAWKELQSIPFFANKFGMYVTGIARPDDITVDEGSAVHRLQGDFNYDEAIMPIVVFGLIAAEYRYGYMDNILKYVHMILNGFSFATPGTTYEVSPDYGMFVQAWNVAGINIPLVQYIFGINPMAYKREITVCPNIPQSWNYAKIERVLVGDNQLSIDYRRESDKETFFITSRQKGWKIKFTILPGSKTVKVNGQTVDVKTDVIELTELNNKIDIFK